MKSIDQNPARPCTLPGLMESANPILQLEANQQQVSLIYAFKVLRNTMRERQRRECIELRRKLLALLNQNRQLLCSVPLGQQWLAEFYDTLQEVELNQDWQLMLMEQTYARATGIVQALQLNGGESQLPNEQEMTLRKYKLRADLTTLIYQNPKFYINTPFGQDEARAILQVMAYPGASLEKLEQCQIRAKACTDLWSSLEEERILADKQIQDEVESFSGNRLFIQQWFKKLEQATQKRAVLRVVDEFYDTHFEAQEPTEFLVDFLAEFKRRYVHDQESILTDLIKEAFTSYQAPDDTKLLQAVIRIYDKVGELVFLEPHQLVRREANCFFPRDMKNSRAILLFVDRLYSLLSQSSKAKQFLIVMATELRWYCGAGDFGGQTRDLMNMFVAAIGQDATALRKIIGRLMSTVNEHPHPAHQLVALEGAIVQVLRVCFGK